MTALAARLAEAARLLAGVWPSQGGRHRAYRALAGALLRAGLPQADVKPLVEALAEATRDEEVSRRVQAVADTAAALRAGKATTGWPALSRELGEAGAEALARFRQALGLTVSLADLAEHKRLPLDFLRGLGLHDLPDGAGVGIPYRDAGGRTVAVKRRTALAAGDGSRWPAGKPLVAYGEDHLAAAVRAGYLTIVEGESDTWTLLYHGEPALGLPGADTVKRALQMGHVAQAQTIYVHREPDAGGEAFVGNVAARLAELGWRGALKVVLLAGAKDPSELHVQCPEGFKAAWREALRAAEPAPVSGGAWPDPVPIDSVPEVAPFPVEVLPARARRFVEEGAAALHCPPDYLAVPALVMLAGALGASRALAVKGRHLQRASLYAAVIGPPGSAKSPAQDAAVAPAHDAEEGMHAAWEQAMGTFEVESEEYEAALREWRKGGQQGERPKKPQRPVLERLTVGDATAEALAPILKENPRGVVLLRDEASAWIRGMDQYREGGRGSDREFYLSAWSGATATVDRKKTHELGPLRVRNPFLCVLGGIVPDNLAVLRGDGQRRKPAQDGFFDRILGAYPREPRAAPEDWLEISDDTAKGYAETLSKLRGLPMSPVQEGGLVKGWRPFVVRLTADGRRAWQSFTEGHAAEVNADDFPQHLRGPWSKLRGYCARLALLLHYARWAEGEVGEGEQDVTGEDVDRAARLVAYFKSHARKIYAALGADPRASAARQLLRRLLREGRPRFTRREAYRAMRGECKSVDDVDPLLDLLEKHGYIRPAPEAGADHRPGRKPSPPFDIHPAALADGLPPGHADDGHSVHCVPEGGEGGELIEGEVP